VKRVLSTVTVLISLTILAPVAFADTVADFYRGRQVTIGHTGGPGGSFAIYSRVLATYLEKYIPGNPKVVVTFKPGGGGMVGMNYFVKAAPKDGTYILMPIAGVETQPFLFPKRARFDPTKVHWLGNMTQLQSFLAVWHTSPVKKWEDARGHESVLGATGKGSETYLTPTLMNNILGTKFKVVTGYKGIMKATLAMEKQEVEGRSGGWTPTMRPDWFKGDRKVRVLVQIGETALDEVWPGVSAKGVPLLKDLAKTEEDRQLFSLLSRVMARPAALPPGTPMDRVAALRKAFAQSMADPGLRLDLQKRNLQITNPMTWRETTAFINRVANLPDKVKERFRAAVTGK
jgi:tripartite-type tricarboxylate transporter receptor subunit TctC